MPCPPTRCSQTFREGGGPRQGEARFLIFARSILVSRNPMTEIRVCATPKCGRKFTRTGRRHFYCGRCGARRKKEASQRSANRRKKDLVGIYQARQKQHDYAQRLKLQVLSHYSPDGRLQCSCPNCPMTAIELLGIDHLFVSGKHHRDRLGHRLAGLRLYRWLRDHNFPPGYQTLCHACNIAKGAEHTCPLAGKKH